MSIFNIFRPIQRRIRSFFRSRMMPMTVDEAAEKKEFFAKMYFLTSLVGICYITYEMYVISINKSSMSPEETIKNFNIKDNVRVIRFEGFKKVADYYHIQDSGEDGGSEHQGVDPGFPGEVIQSENPKLLKS